MQVLTRTRVYHAYFSGSNSFLVFFRSSPRRAAEQVFGNCSEIGDFVICDTRSDLYTREDGVSQVPQDLQHIKEAIQHTACLRSAC